MATASLVRIALRLQPDERGWCASVRLPPPPDTAPSYPRVETATFAARDEARAWAEARARLRTHTPPSPDPIVLLEFHLACGTPPALAWMLAWGGDDGDPVAGAWAASADGFAMHRLLNWAAARTGVHALRRRDAEAHARVPHWTATHPFVLTDAQFAHSAGLLRTLDPALVPPTLPALLDLRAVAPRETEARAALAHGIAPVSRRALRVARAVGLAERCAVLPWRYRDQRAPGRIWFAPAWLHALALFERVPDEQIVAAVRRVAGGALLAPASSADLHTWAADVLGVDLRRRDPRAIAPKRRAVRAKRAVVRAAPGDDGPLFAWARARECTPTVAVTSVTCTFVQHERRGRRPARPGAPA